MVKAGILEDAVNFNSCAELHKYYQGSRMDAAKTGRGYFDDSMSENTETYLINVVRQLPATNDGGNCRKAANFWVALWAERAQRNTEQELSDINAYSSTIRPPCHIKSE